MKIEVEYDIYMAMLNAMDKTFDAVNLIAQEQLKISDMMKQTVKENRLKFGVKE